MSIDNSHVSITMSFEPVRLPPFDDILVLARKNPHGSHGLIKCMDLLAPEDFDLIEVEHDTIEAVVVSRRLQKRVSKDKIIRMLETHVFPEMSPGDLVKVDMDIRKTIQFHQDFDG